MQYLCVGTNIIYKDLFLDVTNGIKGKPKGGIWATKYTSPYYNEWMEFLKGHPSALFYRYPSSPFKLPAIVITLKEDSSIFIVDSREKLEYLKVKYPTPDNWIDYTSLAKDYDAIFVDIHTALSLPNTDERKNLWSFGVTSLIISNPNCIEFYEQAQVQIDPYDYEFETMQYYEIVVDETKRQIEPFPHPEVLDYLTSNFQEDDTTAIDEYLKQNNFDHQTGQLLIRKAFNQS